MAPTVLNVYAFNHYQRALFESHPTGVEDAADLNVDISGSMASSPGKEQALRSVVASMVADSPADGQFEIPTPSGATAIINAVTNCKAAHPSHTQIVITDGCENQHHGPLMVGQDAQGGPVWEHPASNGHRYIEQVAAHLEHGLGAKLFIIGIGPDSTPMVKAMLRRRNVYVAKIDSCDDLRTIKATVDVLFKCSNGGAPSSTRRGVQHALIMPTTPEVVGLKPIADLRGAKSSLDRTKITGSQHNHLTFDGDVAPAPSVSVTAASVATMATAAAAAAAAAAAGAPVVAAAVAAVAAATAGRCWYLHSASRGAAKGPAGKTASAAAKGARKQKAAAGAIPFVAAGKIQKPKRRHARKAADGSESAPPRAPSAYMRFCNEQRAKLPAGLSVPEQGRSLGAAWRALSAAEKAAYSTA